MDEACHSLGASMDLKSEIVQVGFYQDWVGGAVIASLVMATLLVILGASIRELVMS